MFAIEMEGKFRVVNSCGLPACGQVARGTILSKLALMIVVLGMAGETILRRRLQVRDRVRVDMAGRTFGKDVLPIQVELHLVMIEVRAERFPSIVTGHAVRAKGQEMFGGEGLIDLQVTVTA